MEDIRENIATSTVGHDSALHVGSLPQACRDTPVDSEAFEWRIGEMDLAICSTFHFGNIEVENLEFEGEECLLNELCGSEQLLADLRGLACWLVLAPILGLARLAAVEGHALSAGVLSVGAACAVCGGGLAAGRADATRRGLRGHG